MAGLFPPKKYSWLFHLLLRISLRLRLLLLLRDAGLFISLLLGLFLTFRIAGALGYLQARSAIPGIVFWTAAGLLLLGIAARVVGLTREASRLPALMDAAGMLDRRAGLNDELKTALFLANQDFDSAWADIQIHRAGLTASSLHPDELLPFKPPAAVYAATALTLALGVLSLGQWFGKDPLVEVPENGAPSVAERIEAQPQRPVTEEETAAVPAVSTPRTLRSGALSSARPAGMPFGAPQAEAFGPNFEKESARNAAPAARYETPSQQGRRNLAEALEHQDMRRVAELLQSPSATRRTASKADDSPVPPQERAYDPNDAPGEPEADNRGFEPEVDVKGRESHPERTTGGNDPLTRQPEEARTLDRKEQRAEAMDSSAFQDSRSGTPAPDEPRASGAETANRTASTLDRTLDGAADPSLPDGGESDLVSLAATAGGQPSRSSSSFPTSTQSGPSLEIKLQKELLSGPPRGSQGLRPDSYSPSHWDRVRSPFQAAVLAATPEKAEAIESRAIPRKYQAIVKGYFFNLARVLNDDF